ncbi:sensor histidine kinase [Sphingopyxis fribergensis]
MESTKMAAFGRDARSSRLIIVMLSLGFAALLAAAAATFWIQRQNEASAKLVAHTLAVEASLGGFASANERMETARRGLLLTGNMEFAGLVEETQKVALSRAAELAALIADNPRQRERVARLRTMLDGYTRHYKQTIGLTGAARSAMLADFSNDRGVTYVRGMRELVQSMLDEELALLRSREAEQRTTQRLFTAALVGTGLLILLVAGVTLWLVRRNLAELRVSRAELRVLNEDLEVVVDARTAELKRANAEIQRFAYIVSHDLRSPLVNVMGFTAELETARSAIARYLVKSEESGWEAPDPTTRLAIEEDLPEAIGFIRTSTQKMDRLINAILNLSRQGRRTLTPEPLDLTALVNSIAGTVQHRIQETGTTLTIDPLPTIVNDRVAVEQILSNLVENALKYLQPGRPGVIEVRGRSEHGRAIVEVVDNGRGVDPRDHERIFDLFRRSGAQDQPGEGIGLAHARALAYRLGGTIEISSALGEGSTFRLSLPTEWLNGDENA